MRCYTYFTGIILTRNLILGDNLSSDIDTVALIVAGWNSVIRGKDRHTGLFEMKLKQLRILGYKPVVVSISTQTIFSFFYYTFLSSFTSQIYWHEWRQLETQKDRIDFVKRRLSSVINL